MKKKINIITVITLATFINAAVHAQIINQISTAKDKAGEVFKKKDKGNTENKTSDTASTENNNTARTGNSETTTKKDSLATYSKYDFIPGEKVIYFEDFSQDAIGDFPALWNTDISGEVITTNLYTGKWFKMGSNGSFVPERKDSLLPDNYTVEFDLIPGTEDVGFYIYRADNPMDLNEGGAIPGQAGIKIWLGTYQHSYSNYEDGQYINNGNSTTGLITTAKKERVSICVQKQRIRVYVNEVKVFDLAKGLPVNLRANCIRFLSSSDDAPMISDIRIAVGQPDMRNKLMTEGKIISYGIYFDSGSDKLKPESYGSLKEIAAVLTENPTVKIKIVGHTDSDGDDALNLDLSKRRAAAVKKALNTDFAIDNSRIDTDGKGETEPVAPNTTPEGKAKNRRVEFIKE